MQSGALPIAGDLRRLEVDSEDEAAVESLRAYCPTREGDEEIDLQVAHQLLEEPALYARALHGVADTAASATPAVRSEEHTSELQSLMRISYAVFCFKTTTTHTHIIQ